MVEQDTLDFGRDEVQLTFWVANTEQPKAPLSFRIEHDDQGVDHPLIISVDPAQGDTNAGDPDFFSNKYDTFIDGTPITVEDVIWTFETLKTKGSPMYATMYGDVMKAEKTGDRKVLFTFRGNVNRELPLVISGMPVLPSKCRDAAFS